jgi:protocatechuate 3,4-dioxygenase beta subunit
MKTSMRVLATTVLLWSASAVSTDAQAPTPAPAPRAPSGPPATARGTAVISGRILAADTGLPLRRARVTVYGSGPNMPSGPDAMRAAITDAEGAFAFTELRAGRYQLQASKARYVDATFGARRPFRPGKPIELAEGQKVEHITVSLQHAGVIVGRVLDELGEPVAGAMVVPMRAYDSPRGARQLRPAGMSDKTDDIGAYRLYGLSPGTYYVSAQGDDTLRAGIDTIGSAPGFAPTFFPGTAVAAEAQAIEVVAGGEAVADVAMVSTRLSTVSGVVVNAAGALATGGFISAQPSTGAMAFGGPPIGADIKPDGTFAMSGFAPGEYTVQARPMFEPRGPFPSVGDAGMNRRTASTSIVVTGEPIGGLRIVLADPIRIPVAVTFEDATGRPPEQVSVSANPHDMGNGELATRGADGRLTLEVAPGTWHFSAHASAPWIVKRLAFRGEEIEWMDDVEITDESGGRLEVVFTTKSGTVSGTVKDAGGKPVVDYLVYVLPTSDSKQSSRSTVSTVGPDQDGRFKAEHLRPGTYVAMAIEEPDEDGTGDRSFPDFIERLRKAGTTFRVRENETATLDLTLVPRPDQP